LASKVRVEATICDNETIIVAKDMGNGKVAIEIESVCPNIMRFAEMLTEADMKDLTDFDDNRIIGLASKAGLTTTCLVPTAVFNCAWAELGMISKRLAIRESPLCLHFVE
jgi:hypothetical protein